jgi:hypothetical protein
MSDDEKTEYIKPDISLFGDEHVRRYRETDGAVGYEWNGAPCLGGVARRRTDASELVSQPCRRPERRSSSTWRTLQRSGPYGGG